MTISGYEIPICSGSRCLGSTICQYSNTRYHHCVALKFVVSLYSKMSGVWKIFTDSTVSNQSILFCRNGPVRSYHRSKAFESRPRRRIKSRYTPGLRSKATITTPLHHQRFVMQLKKNGVHNETNSYHPPNKFVRPKAQYGEECNNTWPEPSLRPPERRAPPRRGASRPRQVGNTAGSPPWPAPARARHRGARHGGTSRPPPPSPGPVAAAGTFRA